jgi:glycosyltransferase involved in cell wall biosynthesis
VNEGKDGTTEWLSNRDDIDYIHSPVNVGICFALNACRSLVKSDYILYLNDDMYVLPEWDEILYNEIKRLNTKMFMLSATMIEPYDTNNSCTVVADFGKNIDDFKEEKLLADYSNLARDDWSGSTWPPNIVHIDLWDLVGGLSTEFSPGLYSDPDFSRKLYAAGVRIFKGVGRSLVYHFGQRSTKRIKHNKGRDIFLLKWGITPKTFVTYYLHSGEPYRQLPPLVELKTSVKLINKIKKAASSFKNLRQ